MTVTAVYALDIGVYRTDGNGSVLAGTTAAWCRATTGLKVATGFTREGTRCRGKLSIDGSGAFDCGRNLDELARAIADDIRKKNEVALGFEAPMWIPLTLEHSGRMSLFDLRSEQERGSAWYLQSGAAATVKAISLGVLLRELLRTHLGGELPQLSTLPSAAGDGTIVLFEAFVAGDFKAFGDKVSDVVSGRDISDEADALAAALAWGSLHRGFELPPGFTALRLHGSGDRLSSCLSVWSVVLGETVTAGPPDCEVLALERSTW